MKKNVIIVLLVAIVWVGAISPIHAADISTIDYSQTKVISDFAEFDINEHALTFDILSKPSLEQLMEYMPEVLEVYLDDNAYSEAIEVEWFCVGEDYESSESYYFQFSPSWDKELYVLNEDLDLLTEAPYIAVYFTSNNNRISTFSVSDSANEVRIFKYLTEDLGYNTAAACGVMANIYCESSFNPINLQGTYEKKLGYTDASYTYAVDSGSYTNFVNDSAGYGLCQWTYHTRKQGLLDFAKESGTSIGDLVMQLNYFEKEISKTKTGKLMRSVENTANGAYEVGYDFCDNYERPYQKEDEKSVYRGNLAKNTYWAEYGDSEFLPYIDVDKADWFYDAVFYNYENRFMTGLEDVVFGPSESLPRAQFAIILYRINGSPEVSLESEFYDIAGDEWYADAVLWAAQNKIVNGYTNGNFGPTDMITREQMAVIMYRYANYLLDDTSNRGDLSRFVDASSVSEFALESMQWAVGEDIITGKNYGTIIDPQGNTSRAECAIIIQRFMEKYER